MSLPLDEKMTNAACARSCSKLFGTVPMACAIALTVSAPGAAGQDILEVQLIRKIAPRSPFYNFATGPGWYSQVQNSISLSDIQITAKNVKLGVIAKGVIPDDSARDTYLAKNCSSEKKHYSATLTLQVDVGQQVTVTNLTSMLDGSKFSMEIPIYTLKATAESSHSVTVSITDQKSNSYTTKETKEERIERDIEPWTALYVVGERKKLRDILPYTADIVVDGTVSTATIRVGGTTLGATSQRLSLNYPIEDRTLNAVGSVISIFASETEVTYVEQKLDPKNKNHCPPIPGL